MKTIVNLLCITFLLGISIKSKASHIFGGDIGYKNISGNTYEIYLTLYGDCSGQSFPNLINSVPNIKVYNGTSAYTNINLSANGLLGQNVTPVCPSQTLSTTCNGGPIPGVAKFSYKGQVTLNTNSADWEFIFDGDLGTSNQAGRSSNIDNVLTSGGTSIMKLVATLNNNLGPNNAAYYTSIPTPFFCNNIQQQYNQGAIDDDADILGFSLEAPLSSGGTLSYVGGFSATNPLAVSAGNFSFNTTNGQMVFMPNLTQQSLVVNKVTETRNGVIVGSTMREMVFVVLNSCTNSPPTNVNITNASGGTIDALGQMHVCGASTGISFSINSTDPNGDHITATIDGLPTGASANVSGNNTTNLSVLFNWPQAQFPGLGTHTFFITFQDDGCPLSSKQTIAYTIIFEDPINASAVTNSESCVPGNDAQIIMNASSVNGNLSYSVDNINFSNNPIINNLSTGTYTVYIKDGANCTSQITATISPNIKPIISSLIVDPISCNGESDAQVRAQTIPTVGNFVFSITPGTASNSTGIFTNLSPGNYTILLKDDKNCQDTASISIPNPPIFDFTSLIINKLSCGEVNGRITAITNFNNGVTFTLNNGQASNSTGLFENLNEGTYTISAVNANGCKAETTAVVGKNLNDFFIYTWQQNLPCIGKGSEGKAFVVVKGGQSPYNISWNTNPTQTTDSVFNLYYGDYEVTVQDDQGCILTKTVSIESGSCCEQIFIPSAFSPNNDGKNDRVHMITSTGLKIKQYEIFNRWGQSIWKGSDQRDTWDGFIKSAPAKADTYFYILRYTCLSDGNEYSKKGELILIR